ncbi:MAG: hypothetical protein HZC41_09705 [Chloroflexi bacterium]|nr:hypothetical protein [Chloroflexota bacterium]
MPSRIPPLLLCLLGMLLAPGMALRAQPPTLLPTAAEEPIMPPLAVFENAFEPEPTISDDFGFGQRFALDGDTMIIAATGDNAGKGAAYIFVREGSGWVQQARLTASDGVFGDQFGASVAISGDTAVVGAPMKQIGAKLEVGQTYVFTRQGGTWTQQAILSLTGPQYYNRFGRAVAIDGDTIAIAETYMTQGVNIFTRSGTSWTFQRRITPPVTFSTFASGLVLRGTLLLWSALNEFGTGWIYVYEGSGASWTEQVVIPIPTGSVGGCQTFDNFGLSLALDGTTLAVGATGADCTVGGQLVTDHGAVLLYTLPNAAPHTALTSPDGSIKGIGRSLALAGDLLVTGGTTSTDYPGILFQRQGRVWTRAREFEPAGADTTFNFAEAVGIHNGKILANAYVRLPGNVQKRQIQTFYLVDKIDLAVQQSFSPVQVYQLQFLSVNMQVINHSPVPVPGVMFAAAFAPQLAFVGDAHSPGITCAPPDSNPDHLLLCNLGTIQPNTTLTVTADLRAQNPGPIYSVLSAAADAAETDTGNNTSTITGQVYLLLPGDAPYRNYVPGTNANLHWSAVTWATGYEIQIDRTATFPQPLLYQTYSGSETGITIPFTDAGLYFWRVRALKPGGAGLWSSAESLVIGEGQ